MAVLFTLVAHTQKEVSVDSLKNYAGDPVKVCTKIYRGIYPDRNTATGHGVKEGWARAIAMGYL